MPNQCATRFQLGSHFRAHMFDGLKGANDPAKLFAFTRIDHSLFQHILAPTLAARRQRHQT